MTTTDRFAAHGSQINSSCRGRRSLLGIEIYADCEKDMRYDVCTHAFLVLECYSVKSVAGLSGELCQ